MPAFPTHPAETVAFRSRMAAKRSEILALPGKQGYVTAHNPYSNNGGISVFNLNPHPGNGHHLTGAAFSVPENL